MSIHELFEQHFAQQHDIPVEDIAGHRMGNGSYSIAIYATSFRYFKAGFEANKGDKLRKIGYLSEIGALRATQGSVAHFKKSPGLEACIPAYVVDCETHKEGL